MQYLGVHDCLNLILQNKTVYTTFRPEMIEVIFQRHHEQLKNPAAMDYNAAYINLAFIQEVTKLNPMIREVLINNAILMLFNGADPSLNILRSDATGREQLFNHFRDNKDLFNYTKHIFGAVPDSNAPSTCLEVDPFLLQNGSRLPVVYDPYLANFVCYHQSLDDSTNVVITMKCHIPAILFFIDKKGKKTHVEQISKCKCAMIYSRNESEVYMNFQSTTSEYEYVMHFDIQGFLHRIGIFSQDAFFNCHCDSFMFAEKNKYIKVSRNKLNIESIYTSYFPVCSEDLYRCFNKIQSTSPKKMYSFCNIV